MELTKINDITFPHIRNLVENGSDTLILPVGTLEAHGRHAPVGTDNICAEEIALRLGNSTGWPVAPTLNYGITTGLIPYPGGVRLSKKTYAALITEILMDFLRMGFRRIVIVNGHGGNTQTISEVIKELIAEDFGKRHFILVDWWALDGEILEEVYGRPGGHAALDETACILAYRPETLDPDAMKPDYKAAFTPGIISAPYSASMLVYSEGDSTPDFDKDKADLFMEKVLARIEELVRLEIVLFEESFG